MNHEILLHLPGIRITDRFLTIADRRYAVTELTGLRTRRGPHDPVTVRAGACTLIGMVLLGVTATSLPAAGLIGALTSIVALGLLAVLRAWRRPRGFSLWAEHRGITLQLYYSDDERIFGYVCRTLIRARERAGGARTPNPPYHGRYPEMPVPRTPTPHAPTRQSLRERARGVFAGPG